VRALRFALACALGLGLAGCATTHLARPVGRGNTRFNLSAGGPLVRVGATIPMPLTTVEVARGIEDDIDLHAGIYPTALAFSPGNGSSPLLGMSVGGAWHPIPRHRSALTVGAVLYGFSNRVDGVVFGDAWIAGNLRATSWLNLAAGVHNMVRLASSSEVLDQRSVWSPTAFAQVAFGPFGRWEIQLEARWYAFTENGFLATPNYYPIGQLGDLGALVGVSYQLPGGGR
jgi:hypothetical protein